MRLPPLHTLKNIIFNEKACRLFLWNTGAFYQTLPCQGCGDGMAANQDRTQFRCAKRSCETRLSIRSHTFFSGSRLNCCQIMHLGYLWLNRNSQTQAVNQTGCSAPTVTAFFSHFRTLVATTLLEEDTKIGGQGIIVEIDETKLGKRKYHRGHRVNGVWVIVGIEKTPERRVFMQRIEDRSANTLECVIQEHVIEGSIVHTDLWRGYQGIEKNLGFVHRSVNHSLHLTDPITGVNTNTVEGTNNALKIQIRPRNRTTGVDEHLSEFIWRRKNFGRLWPAFLEALRDIHYDLQ